MAHNRKENAMSHLDIIRAWKDEEYRLSLSDAERAQLPANPGGLIELTDVELGAVAGAAGQALGLNQAVRNANDGISMVQTAEGGFLVQRQFCST
jgi:mersacidin/lichenicidin family type 2 lantibiotic